MRPWKYTGVEWGVNIHIHCYGCTVAVEGGGCLSHRVVECALDIKSFPLRVCPTVQHTNLAGYSGSHQIALSISLASPLRLSLFVLSWAMSLSPSIPSIDAAYLPDSAMMYVALRELSTCRRG